MDEKGPINNVMALIVMVSAAVLILIFVGVLSGQTFNLSQPMINAVGNSSVSNDNVSSIMVLNTAVSLDYTRIQPGTLTLFNGSSGVAYNLANFSVDYVGGTVTWLNSSLPVNTTQLNASDYYWNGPIRDNVYSSVQSVFQALSQTGQYLPIIVLAIVIAIVLSLVLGFTALGGGAGRGGSAL